MAPSHNKSLRKLATQGSAAGSADTKAPATLSPAARAARKQAAPKFSDLGLYQAMLKMRARAELVGVKNPFFRTHDDRAGVVMHMAGQDRINFASYDYLGLNSHPAVGAAAVAAVERYGTSVSASRLVAGESPLHQTLEAAIARHYRTEAALAFVSGHATNVSTIATLMSEGDLIVHDELIHNSALIGAKLSQATTRAFRHNDLASLEAILEEARAKHRNALVIVEGLYSMDGDFPDLARLVAIKEKHRAWLMVDEAHALGVLGRTGHGSFEHSGVDPADIDIWMGTLSKTLASCGGYIAGSRELIEILKFHAPGFVYSVGMPPAAAAAATTALALLHSEPDRVQRLQANSRMFLQEAKAACLETGPASGYAVVPIMIGDSFRAAKLTERLLGAGFNVLPIVFPAVPLKSARMRFFITSEHTPEQIIEAVRATREAMQNLSSARMVVAGAIASLIG